MGSSGSSYLNGGQPQALAREQKPGQQQEQSELQDATF